MAKLGKGAKFGDKVKAFKDDTVTAGKDTFGKLTHKTANAAAANMQMAASKHRGSKPSRLSKPDKVKLRQPGKLQIQQARADKISAVQLN